MKSLKEYVKFDGLGLAELINERQIGFEELCEAAIARAEEINPRINAIITPLYDFARSVARQMRPGALFSGVPFLLKDAHHALKGFATSSGSNALKDKVDDNDAEIVKRFRETGLVILGKTSTPEFKLAGVTEPKAFGPTRNPWNTDYSPGGSSGGSAAAVAARIVPLASATDEGGSIRIPASYCGLFGLKPSRGRNPVGPDLSLEWGGMSTSHVISRSVRDSAAMLDAVSGPEPGGRYHSPDPGGAFLGELESDPKPLRIGYYTRPGFGRSVHPECVKAVENACRLLEGLGHHVEEMDPGFSEENVALQWCIVMLGHLSVYLDRLAGKYGMKILRRGIELPSYAMYRLGQHISAVDLISAGQRWQELGRTMDAKFERLDMFLCPTLGTPPVKVGSQKPRKADEFIMKLISTSAGKIIFGSRWVVHSVIGAILNNTLGEQMPFTMIANVTGNPAMSVPLHWTAEGLPCGVQFIGPFGGEAALFKLAAQLERARPWSERMPGMV